MIGLNRSHDSQLLTTEDKTARVSKSVDVSKDSFGFVLVWTRDQPTGERAGEAVEAPMSGAR